MRKISKGAGSNGQACLCVSTRRQGARGKVFLILLLLFIIYCSLFNSSEARIYIDITSPAFKKLPVAVSEFGGPNGREVSDIIASDLDYTGIFLCLDRKLFIEDPAQPFQRSNWSIIGAELVLKGNMKRDGNSIISTLSLYDVAEAREIFRKEYQTGEDHLRQLAHTIANDVYKQITGDAGIFRTRIAFVARQKGHDELFLMDWDGRGLNSLRIKQSVLLGPRWSNDGQLLLYSSVRDRKWIISLLDLKGMTEKNIISSEGTNIAGDFLPDGREFAMSSSMSGVPNIYMYNIAALRLTRLTASRGIEVTPSASPDGRFLAYVSDKDGTPQIFVMNRDGDDIRRLTFNGSYNTSPSWSPKGGKIVFSGRQNGRNQIFVMNSDGTGTTQLTDRGNNEDPSFSPDERYIVFTSDRDGEKGIYRMRFDGEAQKRISPKGMRAFGPRWSPN
ncbi:MAG: Tol-Pal system beta propeller repeat protein TolB [Nitrospirota bacterium]